MTTYDENHLTFIGRTNFHNERRLFGIRRRDRRAHTYVIGKTGTGKSTLLETLIRQDIEAGEGLAILDPHGSLVESALSYVPGKREADVIYFNVPDRTNPMGFNPLERVTPEKRPLAASGLIEAFKKLWAEFWGPRSEHILRNALLALLDQREATLADVPRLFDDRDFRRRVTERVANEHVRRFWLREYEGYPARLRAEAIAPLQNKVGAFLSNPILHPILTQQESALNIRRVMDEGKLLLVNLAKGKIGEDAAMLLGALLVTSLGVSGLSRADLEEEERRDFYVYLDEFQSFTTLSLATMLSELRKYRMNLVLAHQYLSQLEPEMQDAIVGNVGTIISFRLGMNDAELMAKEFYPVFSADDLISLPNYSVYLKLMVEGTVTSPFSAATLKPTYTRSLLTHSRS